MQCIKHGIHIHLPSLKQTLFEIFFCEILAHVVVRTVILFSDWWTVLESRPYFSPITVLGLPSQNVMDLSNYFVHKLYILQLIKVKMKNSHSCFDVALQILLC